MKTFTADENGYNGAASLFASAMTAGEGLLAIGNLGVFAFEFIIPLILGVVDAVRQSFVCKCLWILSVNVKLRVHVCIRETCM